MKQNLLTFLSLLCLNAALAQNQGEYNMAKQRVIGLMTPSNDTINHGVFVPEALPNNAFKPGERLEYNMRYGFVVGAKAVVTLKEEEYKNKKVYHASAKAKTVGLADLVFGVEDIYESYFIPETNLPLKSIRSIKESTYNFYNEVEYYHEEGKVYSQRSKKFKKVKGGILDLVSAFYHARRVHFSKGKNINDTVSLETYFDDRIFQLRVVYRGKETIKVKAGKIRCMKFNPLVEAGRVFDTENDVIFWVSDDPNYILIRAQMNLMIGSFKGDLVKHEGLLHPLAKEK